MFLERGGGFSRFSSVLMQILRWFRITTAIIPLFTLSILPLIERMEIPLLMLQDTFYHSNIFT
jgi:hypothetical protein